MKRLSNSTAQALEGRVRLPAYDREQCSIGVVHLGLGAFHRAHQAVYFDELLQQDPVWAISGVSMRSPEVRDQMLPQDGLYSLVTLNGEELADRVIGSVREALFLGDDRQQVLARMSSNQTRLITLTVTEKAYCLASLDGGVNFAHPVIVRDLEHPELPESVLGLLARSLATRREQGGDAVTILCCDNLPGNGTKLRRALLEFAARVDLELCRWIENEVAFPSSMVDRIVPKTREEDRRQLAERLGLQDSAMVKAEPFSQWVIEDRFNGTPPDLSSVGALLVDDVEAYERMKLRLLNGAHSTIAYLGCLGGYRHVDEAMASPVGALVASMMTQEILPVTEIPRGFDARHYIAELLLRFRNSGLQHQCSQIAMDGSQKVPIRLLDTITRCLQQEVPCDRLVLGVAAWIRYATGIAEDGSRVEIDDPMSDVLTSIGARAGLNADQLVEEFLHLTTVFPGQLVESQPFRGLLTRQLRRLIVSGAEQAARL